MPNVGMPNDNGMPNNDPMPNVRNAEFLVRLGVVSSIFLAFGIRHWVVWHSGVYAEFGIPMFGIPLFGIPSFGIPLFGILSFSILTLYQNFTLRNLKEIYR
jgi:hypothetical protein